MIRVPPHVAAEALRRLRELERGGRYEHLVREVPSGRGVHRVLPVPTTLRAEPISTFIGLSALIASATGISFAAAAAIGGILVSTTISFGLSIAAKALSKSLTPGQSSASAQQAAGINDPAVSHNTRQVIPAKRIIYGFARVGGALFFEKVVPPYLYHGLLLCDRRIAGVIGVYIGANVIPFATFTPNTILTPSTDLAGAPRYSTHLRMSLGLGTLPASTDVQLAAAFPNLSPNFRQTGIARVVFRYDYGTSADDFVATWGNIQFPNPNLIVQGVPVYDPRDPTQSRDGEYTWKFSNNAALVQADYLRSGFGGRIRSTRIDWDRVAAAADYDDQQVGCLDGTSLARYTIDGVIALDQSPFDIMTAMLSANRGFIHEAGGTVWVASSPPLDPVTTIHDGILAGTLDFRGAAPKKSVLNRVTIKFIAADREYQQVDGPVLNRTDLQTADGEVLEARVSFPFTRDYRRAERLQKAILDSSRLGRTITCRCNVSILTQTKEELVGSAVRFDSVLFSPANGIYRVQSVAFADDFATVELTLTEYDKNIETSWRTTDERAFTVAPLDLS